MDYLTGSIFDSSGGIISQISGNYMGYIDFDEQRYFDVRAMEIYEVTSHPLDQSLKSDSRLRPDSIELFKNNVEQAQTNKEELE
jgi:hypothetical protein